jgi:tetratricopeptide (TPR) repeat protein
MPIRFLGIYYWRRGVYAKAEAYFEEALALGRNHGMTTTIIWSLLNLGLLALSQGDRKQAAERFDESLAISLDRDSQLNIAWSLTNAGLMAWEAGDFEQASQKYARAVAIRKSIGIGYLSAQTFLGSGRVSLELSEYSLARTYLEQALEISQSEGDQETIFRAMEAFSIRAVKQKEKVSKAELERAGRLLGSTQALHMKWRLTRMLGTQTESAIAHAEARVKYLSRCLGRGQAMTLEQAITARMLLVSIQMISHDIRHIY